MTPERLFSIANALAAVSWLLLLLLPRRRWVIDIVTGQVVPALFAVLYIGLVVTMFGRSDGGFSTLAGVATLFANPWMLLAGWMHYLAFDLLIGTWEVRDAQARGIPHLLVAPCLILTFLFGPAGWLLYLTVRSAVRRDGQPSPV
jgi:hypothetical protein